MRSIALITFLAITSPAAASVIPAHLDGAELRGAATFRFIGLPLYDARLYTLNGKALDWTDDFGLELTYRRAVAGLDLVEGTMRELARTGASLPIRDKLRDCYADVLPGDRYAAVSKGPDRLDFWHNDTRTCTLAFPAIKSHFMTIFLGDNTRSANFTRKLRGE